MNHAASKIPIYRDRRIRPPADIESSIISFEIRRSLFDIQYSIFIYQFSIFNQMGRTQGTSILIFTIYPTIVEHLWCSHIRYPASGIWNPVSSIPYLTSRIPYLASGLRPPVSGFHIFYPASRIQDRVAITPSLQSFYSLPPHPVSP